MRRSDPILILSYINVISPIYIYIMYIGGRFVSLVGVALGIRMGLF